MPPGEGDGPTRHSGRSTSAPGAWPPARRARGGGVWPDRACSRHRKACSRTRRHMAPRGAAVDAGDAGDQQSLRRGSPYLRSFFPSLQGYLHQLTRSGWVSWRTSSVSRSSLEKWCCRVARHRSALFPSPSMGQPSGAGGLVGDCGGRLFLDPGRLHPLR